MTSSSMLKMQHSSMQFSDTSAQQKKDVHDLFSKGQQYPIKTGTESADEAHNDNHRWLRHYAELYDHRIHFVRDNWVAVSKYIIDAGSWKTEEVFVAHARQTAGHGHDTAMAAVSFDHHDPRLGRISVGSIHYPVKGSTPGSANFKWTKEAAKKIDDWLMLRARGTALGFANGDFNMPDKSTDWAHGGHFTSIADELKAWQNTGHGPIDGFCSYDRDGRVQAESFNVLDDSEFFQFGDHFVCRGTWKVKHLGGRK